MTQGMKHDPWQLPVADYISPIPRELIGRIGRAVQEGENQIIGTRPAGAQC
jgi:hypothetical protein